MDSAWQVNLELHFMFAMWIGAILAWRWEGLGGALMLGGVIGFCIVEGRIPNALFWIMGSCGAAYLCCRLAGLRHGKQVAAGSYG